MKPTPQKRRTCETTKKGTKRNNTEIDLLSEWGDVCQVIQLCTDDLVRRAKGLWLLGSLIPFFIKLKFNNKVLGFRVRSYRLYPHGVDFNPNE